jgi:hypothetical protein
VMGYLIVAYSGSYNGAFGFLIGCAVVSVAVSMTLRSNKRITADRIGKCNDLDETRLTT